MALKVFGGLTFKGGMQMRTLVAASSQKAAAKLVGTSLDDFRAYWSVTGNRAEVEAALAQPGIALLETEPRSGIFKPANT